MVQYITIRVPNEKETPSYTLSEKRPGAENIQDIVEGSACEFIPSLWKNYHIQKNLCEKKAWSVVDTLLTLQNKRKVKIATFYYNRNGIQECDLNNAILIKAGPAWNTSHLYGNIAIVLTLNKLKKLFGEEVLDKFEE